MSENLRNCYCHYEYEDVTNALDEVIRRNIIEVDRSGCLLHISRRGIEDDDQEKLAEILGVKVLGA